ncbi:MAG TPA: right-handed parallel beta-helix repeat-containing protein [Kofleriaceae bacterium]|nr:right-handed parallel beta-helix repeat-containing protein [Kofleriaceae bacterium]
MRRLPLLVLAACSNTTTNHQMDAGPDAKPYYDARTDAVGSPDAYAARPCDAPVSFAEGLVPTRVLHVEAGAVGGDGSAEKPFGSIAAAAAIATPGTFIQLGLGNHATNQFIPNLHGTATAPIWIGGVQGTHPKINGGAEGLHLTAPQYVVIQNLELHGQSANGIDIDDSVGNANDAHHVTLSSVDVYDVLETGSGTEAGIKASGVNDLAIHDSVVLRCGIGIELVGVHDSVVARNVVSGSLLHGIRARGGSTDVDIRQNKLRDNGTTGVVLGGSTPFSQFRPPLSMTAPNAEARRVRSFDNVVTGASSSGFSFISCVDCLVAHNLVFGSPLRLVGIYEGNSSQNGYTFELTKNGRVINNSFVWTSPISFGHVDVGVGSSAATFTFSHDLWLALSTPSQSTPYLGTTFNPVPDTGAVIGIGTGYSADPTVYCGGPEASTATPLPEVDGTIEGWCRSASVPTIGPLMLSEGACDL